MSLYINNIISEGLSDTKSFRTQVSTQNTTNTTKTLVLLSEMVQAFTGSVVGQIVKLPNATTLSNGHRFEVWNLSSTPISIVGDTLITVVTGNPNVITILILLDNTTAAGIWGFSQTNKSLSSNTVGAITFNRPAAVVVGAYLNVGNTLGSTSGYVINGYNYITKLSVTSGITTMSGKTATFRLRRRITVDTFVDITGTDITIQQLSYNTTVSDILVPMGPDWEIVAYRISGDPGGASVSDVVLNAFITPQ